MVRNYTDIELKNMTLSPEWRPKCNWKSYEWHPYQQMRKEKEKESGNRSIFKELFGFYL